MNLWQQLPKPIIGLAPMDGVSDLSYRIIQAEYGHPDVIFTEFIPIEGIIRLNNKLLTDFWYTESQRPIIGQIYGNDPALFYAAAQLVCELGFDGVDINMGCPAKSVVHRGCGAALIRTPELAIEIITVVKQAVLDWQQSGLDWNKWPVISAKKAEREFTNFINMSKDLGIYNNLPVKRKLIPVSVKTRIGYEQPQVEEWIGNLLTAQPDAITLHGRTLKQLYTGKANWELIKLAVDVRDSLNSETIILGNGDVKSVAEALQRVKETKLDGVLIGRASFGNPNVFKKETSETDLAARFSMIIAHAKLHEKYKPPQAFVQMRKNLAWYISSFPGAVELRSRLMLTNNSLEVETILREYLENS